MQRTWIKNCGYSLAALILLGVGQAFAQQGNALILRFPGVPTGGCAPIMLAFNDATGDEYGCKAGAWFLIGPVAGGAHLFLSATHTDTTPAAATRGDGVFAVGGTPTWQRVAHSGAAGGYWKWNGTDVVASTGAAAGTGSCTNQFATALNADAAPSCTTATLASAQFANQGTTVTVLHGNAAGNPSFGAVIDGDLSGQVGAPHGGTGLASPTANGIPYTNGVSAYGVVASPVTKGLWQVVWNLPTDAAAAPTAVLAGVTNRTYAAAGDDPILFSDQRNQYTYSGAVAVSLPTPTTLENAHFAVRLAASSVSTVTVTPTTWTINGAATLVIPPLKTCLITVGAGTDWSADCPAVTVFSGSQALGTTEIGENACAAVVDVTAANVVATDAVEFTPNASIKAVTGYEPAGTLSIVAYPAAGHIYLDVCNKDQTNHVTPGAVTVNLRVPR